MHKRICVCMSMYACMCVCAHACVTTGFFETSRGQSSSHLNHNNSNISLLGLREKNHFLKISISNFFPLFWSVKLG